MGNSRRKRPHTVSSTRANKNGKSVGTKRDKVKLGKKSWFWQKGTKERRRVKKHVREKKQVVTGTGCFSSRKKETVSLTWPPKRRCPLLICSSGRKKKGKKTGAIFAEKNVATGH